MDYNEELDIDFDFEKEFGVDLDALLGEDVGISAGEDIDLDHFLAENNGSAQENMDLSNEIPVSFQNNAPVSPEAPVFISEDTPVIDEPPVLFQEEIQFDNNDDFDMGATRNISLELAPELNKEEDIRIDFSQSFDNEPDLFFAPNPIPPVTTQAFDLPEELDLSQEPAFNEAAAPEVPQNSQEAASTETVMQVPRRRPRRKKPSKMRVFKDVYLPVLIAGVAVILMLTFIIGAIVRAVNDDGEETMNDPTGNVQSEKDRLQQEADKILKEATLLAAGYDYQGALDKIDSFEGDIANYKDLRDKKAEYAAAKDQAKAWTDPASIPNLSFHVLIADPSRAFVDEEFGKAYNMNFVTIDEFSKILDQLYTNGFVLVDLDSFIEETKSDDGKVTYSSKPIYLPEGKKPIMITETLVNYFDYMIDGDDDGVPDAKGGGFASRLIVDSNGEITCEMVDASGNTVTGDYDLVPILNKFIDAHPDFSYHGSKAILAVTGDEGVFGYRTMPSVIKDKGQSYYNSQVEGAKKVAQALRDDGYTIACYTYDNIDYNKTSATGIDADLKLWKDEVVPVLGQIDVMVYARGSDITTGGGYSGNTKYNVMKDEGFRYFLGAANVPWAEVTKDYVRQSRLMVTGSQMANTSSIYANYFDSKSILNEQRNAN